MGKYTIVPWIRHGIDRVKLGYVPSIWEMVVGWWAPITLYPICSREVGQELLGGIKLDAKIDHGKNNI